MLDLTKHRDALIQEGDGWEMLSPQPLADTQHTERCHGGAVIGDDDREHRAHQDPGAAPEAHQGDGKVSGL